MPCSMAGIHCSDSRHAMGRMRWQRTVRRGDLRVADAADEGAKPLSGAGRAGCAIGLEQVWISCSVMGAAASGDVHWSWRMKLKKLDIWESVRPHVAELAAARLAEK